LRSQLQSVTPSGAFVVSTGGHILFEAFSFSLMRPVENTSNFEKAKQKKLVVNEV